MDTMEKLVKHVIVEPLDFVPDEDVLHANLILREK
jgi:hypothetical protein